MDFHWLGAVATADRDAVRAFGGGWHDARHRHARACRRRDFPPNRIKASLSAFQRREVKVLGFGVKARPRPQRMALRWLHVPFALVGANGKACGEAPGVLFSGTPRGCWGVLSLLLWFVYRVYLFAVFAC